MNKQKANIAFIFPNLLTAASIFSAILSMTHAISAEFEKASWLIFLSLIFDGLDGRVARLTNSCSKFGVEFDSLADVVAFGVAPALLIYQFSGHEFGRFGIVVSALYVVFGAIRLARFNVMSSASEPSVFIGVPIPTAAVFLALLVLLFNKYSSLQSGVFLMVAAIVVALLMVSNIRYPSFKKIQLDKKSVRKIFIAITALFMVIFIYPIEGIVAVFTLYILYGPLRTLQTLLRSKKATSHLDADDKR